MELKQNFFFPKFTLIKNLNKERGFRFNTNNNNKINKQISKSNNYNTDIRTKIIEKNHYNSSTSLINELPTIESYSPVMSKIKGEYNSFNLNPNVEEVPKFCYENDLNVNLFSKYIKSRKQFVDKNYTDYINYINKFENKNKISKLSPYSFCVKKLEDRTKFNNSYYNKKKQANKIDEINNRNASYNNGLKMLSPFSLKNNTHRRSYEITNPELYYKKTDGLYNKYIQKHKNFDDYNYKIYLNKYKNQNNRKEPDINPFNPLLKMYRIGNSQLQHNIILKPQGFCGY